MAIVIDTSALIAVLTNEPLKLSLVEVTQGEELVAPASVHWEVGNAFSSLLKRKRLSLAECQWCLEAYDLIPIRWVDLDLKGSLSLAHEHRLYAYDAYVLLCAQISRHPLLTLDEELKMAAQALGISIVEVSQ